MSDTLQLDKPRHGQPCNGCGICCIREQCQLSIGVFGERAVCPAIERDGPRLTCGLINRPAMYFQTKEWSNDVLSETCALLLGAGGGCDAGSDDDTDHEAAIMMRLSAVKAINGASDEAQMLVGILTGRTS